MTNFEKIKQMSIEEMADKFEMREFFAVAYNGTYDKRHRPALEWLESEADTEQREEKDDAEIC